jgi:hypothetical protein
MNVDDSISSSFKQFCKENDLQMVAENIDRHGSLEWLAVHTDSMQRFVSVAFTEFLPEGMTKSHIAMESWAQVVSRDRSRRVRAFEEILDQFTMDAIEPYLRKALDAAWDTARSLTEDSLESIPSLLQVPSHPTV